jgi:hypothetical protein
MFAAAFHLANLVDDKTSVSLSRPAARQHYLLPVAFRFFLLLAIRAKTPSRMEPLLSQFEHSLFAMTVGSQRGLSFADHSAPPAIFN